MTKVKLTIEEAFQHEQKITVFMQNAEKLSGSMAIELYSLKRAYKEHTQDARELEEDLKNKFPFKWSHELPVYEDGDKIERVFDGSSADEKADEKAKKERAKLDKEEFDKRWDAAKSKEKEFTWEGVIKKSEITEMTQHGSLFFILMEVLEHWDDNIKDDKKKGSDPQ